MLGLLNLNVLKINACAAVLGSAMLEITMSRFFCVWMGGNIFSFMQESRRFGVLNWK